MSTRDKLVMLVLFGGFATLFFEVRYEHRSAVKEVWQAWIPIGYAGLAALASLAALGAKKGFRKAVNAVFGLGLAVGVYGLYMHVSYPSVSPDFSKFEKFLMPDKTVYSGAMDSRGHPVPTLIFRPIAAPLGITGLAAVGFVMTSGLFRAGRGSAKES